MWAGLLSLRWPFVDFPSLWNQTDPRVEQSAALGSQGAHYWKLWSCLIWAMKLSVCKQFFNQTHTHTHTHLVCFVFSLLVWDYLFLCSRWGERHNTFITDKDLHFTCTMKHHGVPESSTDFCSIRITSFQKVTDSQSVNNTNQSLRDRLQTCAHILSVVCESVIIDLVSHFGNEPPSLSNKVSTSWDWKTRSFNARISKRAVIVVGKRLVVIWKWMGKLRSAGSRVNTFLMSLWPQLFTSRHPG